MLVERGHDGPAPVFRPLANGSGLLLQLMRYLVRAPATNTRGPIYTEALLKSIHKANLNRQPVRLQFQADERGVCLSVDLPQANSRVFVQELLDAYPGVNVELARPVDVSGLDVWSRQLWFSPDLFQLHTFDKSEDDLNRVLADPISGILSALRTGRSGTLSCQVDLTIIPAKRKRYHRLKRVIRRVSQGFKFASCRRWYLRWSTSSRRLRRAAAWLLSLTPKSTLGSEISKAQTCDFKAAQQLFECSLVVITYAPRNSAEKATKWLDEVSASLGRFSSTEVELQLGKTTKGKPCHGFSRKRSFLLTPQEIASIWHPPTVSTAEVARLRQVAFREIEPPASFPSKEGRAYETALGRVRFRNQKQRCVIQMDDLRRHLLVLGRTGCGKSTFLLSTATQLIQQDRGLILIDPHGQLASELLEYVPRRRINDVIVFDAGEKEYPVGFNPLLGPAGSDPVLVADGVLTAFKNVFGFDESTAPRLLHIFRNSLLSLVGTPAASLLSVQRLLIDDVFRKSVVSGIKNPVVREFWRSEFNRWPKRDRTLYIASLQNKLGAFLANERLQNIFQGDRKVISIRETMDTSKILICNLSKGIVGHDASTLLGSLLLSSIHIAAMSRANLPEQQRPDCVVMVDEFHSYLSEGNTTIADALAESRKYRASYILSSQMLEQLDEATKASVLGNCGSTLCMTVGPRDAEVFAELLGHDLTIQNLMDIPKYHGYMRMLVDGAPNVFSMTTICPKTSTTSHATRIRRVSQQRYGNPIDQQR